MKSCKTVSEANCVREAKGRIRRGGTNRKITGTGHGVICARIARDMNIRPIGSVVSRIANRYYRIDVIIRSAQENKEQFLTIKTYVSFSKRSFHDKRYVHQSGQSHADT